MKKLGDYKDEEAIDLWARLIEPISTIMSDKEVEKIFKNPDISIAQKAAGILTGHTKEVQKILLTIDDTPIDGINLVIRLIDILKEIEENEDLKVFFLL